MKIEIIVLWTLIAKDYVYLRLVLNVSLAIPKDLRHPKSHPKKLCLKSWAPPSPPSLPPLSPSSIQDFIKIK